MTLVQVAIAFLVFVLATRIYLELRGDKPIAAWIVKLLDIPEEEDNE
ncbi:MAG: hypothetical protein LKJ69_01670 [Lactobacillus sp.]|jgi:hypothetical protein|nr:hypothetical protein [Lactobacillus sp.]MCI2032092.1 hypothetical protein [Lactobacillus sp.]